MSRLLLASLFLIVTPALHADEWHNLTSDEGQFKLSMPGEPTYKKGNLTDGTSTHQFMFESADKNVAFLVMYQDTPGLGNGPVGDTLERLRDGGVKSIPEGKLLKESRIKIGEHHGLQFEFEGTGIKRVTWQVYIVGDRLYQLGVVDLKHTLPGSEIQRFQKSFRLID